MALCEDTLRCDIFSVAEKSKKTSVWSQLPRAFQFELTAGSAVPSIFTSSTCSSCACIVAFGDTVQRPVRETADPVERLQTKLSYESRPGEEDIPLSLDWGQKSL